MAEVVGGMLLGFLVDYVFDKIKSLDYLSSFRIHKLDEGILKKLKINMITMNGLLDHAEEKQITVPAVRMWLDELSEAVFKVDDLLDVIGYEGLRNKVEAGSSKYMALMCVHNHSRGMKMKQLNKKFKEVLGTIECLIGQMEVLGLTLREGIGETPSSQKVPATSLPDSSTSSVYGRDEEQRDICNALGSRNDSENVSIISIVGIGGMGKTTLARLVYNSSEVHDNFDLKFWVYGREDFEVSKITRDNLKNLQGKKFLLVLDDVWSDEDGESNKWENLFTLLKGGAQGSKIVITTRNKEVASATKLPVDLTCHLKGLREDDCWSLLAEYAFDDDERPDAYPELEKIGKEIARRCQGLPLAAKLIGSALRSKTIVAEWKRVSESNVWEVVPGGAGLAALKLSYYYLPSQIKQCVAYCAIFPKGFRFRRELLIHLWKAEGLLGGDKVNEAKEHVGNEYIDLLISRSFFQQENSDEASFTMHDVIHDLCESVSGEFCFSFKPGISDSFELPMKTRYLSQLGTNWRDYNEIGGDDGGQLRTFLYIHNYSWSPLNFEKPQNHDFLLRFKRLRVLSLAYRYSLYNLPISIGNLKHLRYLNLEYTRIKRLPESLCRLYYLQTLILWRCSSLTELPTNIVRLINLCYLDIRDTKLRRLPAQMNKLRKLQILTNFILGKKRGCRIQELGKLHHLRGQLSIENLQHVVNYEQAYHANLKDKALEKLELTWSGKSKNKDHAEHLLQRLKPHPVVNYLSIKGYEGEKFPDWLHDLPSSWYNSEPFPKLVRLKLSDCENCSLLPPLGQLPFLKELSISNFHKINTVASEFYGSCNNTPPPKQFPTLQILRFIEMSQWCEWRHDDGAFPCLKELYIENCPILRKTLPSELPCLTKLDIQSCQQLEITVPRVDSADFTITLDGKSHFIKLASSGLRLIVEKSFDSLVAAANKIDALAEVEFRGSESLSCFPLQSFPRIKSLHIKGCPNLKYFFAAEASSSEDLMSPFQEIYIYGDTMLSIGPLLRAETIQTVSLQNHRYHVCFSKLPSGLCCLEVHKLASLNRLQTYLSHDVASAVEEIKINAGFEFFPSLELFPQLKFLAIWGVPDLVNFSEEGLIFAPNLTRLRLLDCHNLKLPECMHSLFPCLLKLEIIQCSELESFPPSFLPSKLQLLHIEECHELSSLTLFIEDVEKKLLPSALTSVTLRNLQSLVSLEYGALPQLASLEIGDCSKLEYMQDCMQATLPSLVYLTIYGCQELNSFLKGGLPSNLQGLGIWCCDKLVAGLMQYDLRTLASLSQLTIGGYHNMTNLEEEMLLPFTLTTLELRNFASLESIRLQHLGSLQSLTIGDCPWLQEWPVEELSSSVSFLRIYGCPLLMERFSREEERSKISHIPEIQWQ